MGGDRSSSSSSSSSKKLRPSTGDSALSPGEGDFCCVLFGILGGALRADRGKFERVGLALPGGDTAVLVCNGLGVSVFCDLVGKGGKLDLV